MSYNPQNPNGQTTSANSEPVVIASDQSTIPVSVSGVATAANQSTANTSLASIDGKITAVNTGSVTVSSSVLPTGSATSAKQSDGSQKSQIVDGAGNVIGSTGNALDINIKTSAGTQTISGTVTANAGTNLNTSALALEAGGNLASVRTNTDNLNLAQGSTTSGQKGNLVQGAVTTSAPTYITAQTSPLSLTTAGALRVDSSASTQPVSGTVTANAGSGTMAVSAVSLPLPTGAATAANQSTANTSLASIDGKITAVNTGAVVVSSSALPTGAATAANQSTANTSLSSIDTKTPALGQATMANSSPVVLASDQTGLNVTSTGNVASGAADSGNPVKVGAKYNSTKPTFADGQRGDLQLGTRGSLGIQIMNVDGTAGAAVITPADASTGAGSLSVQSQSMAYNGTTWDRVRSGPTTGSVLISPPTATGAAVPANAFFVGGKDTSGNLQGLSTLNANGDATGGATILGIGNWLFNGTTWDRVRSGGVTGMAGVSGDTASAATDAGNPVKIGGVGKTANPTAVTDGQRVNAIFDKLGKQVVVNSIRDLKGVQQTTITSSTAETTIVTAVASTFLDLYSLILTNTSASGTKVTIKDSTAGTTRTVIYVPANDTRGFTLTESAAIVQATVNNNWTATCGTSVASIEVTALYVKNT